MRRTSRAAPRLFNALALASALCLPAAAIAAQFDYFIKLPPIEGDSGKGESHGEMEIQSYSWGATQTPGRVHEIGGLKYEVDVVESTGAASKDMVMKGSNIGENSSAKRLPGKRTPPTVTLKRGATAEEASAGGVRVAVGDVTGDGSPGVAEYNPKELTVSKEVVWNAGQPAPTGSVTVRGKFPSCTVGARFPTLELGARAARYKLHNVVVTSCGGSAGEALPMEEVSFNYTKVEF